MSAVATTFDFSLTGDRIAAQPPEARGLRRDEVKLLVATPDRIVHTRFHGLGHHLRRGDLLIVNTSPTMPAALDAWLDAEPVDLHLSTLHDDGTWTVEVRCVDGRGPVLTGAAGDTVEIVDGAVELLHPADRGLPGAVRLWRAAVRTQGELSTYLHRHGRPIRYAYVHHRWPLRYYQTVFADHRRWPGSAEMPSAGRPFSQRVLRGLRHAGVGILPIRLDTGVSSPEVHEPPQPERFDIPESSADAINRTRADGGRVVAVGTTVTRAIETAATPDGDVRARSGWTDLVLGPDRPARVVDGIITGWHPPEASHLQLLQAVVGRRLVGEAYQAALANRYLWHEFGDSALLLNGPE